MSKLMSPHSKRNTVISKYSSFGVESHGKMCHYRYVRIYPEKIIAIMRTKIVLQYHIAHTSRTRVRIFWDSGLGGLDYVTGDDNWRFF